MRTTIPIDAAILQTAEGLPHAREISVGATATELARRGLEQVRPEVSGALPHFPVTLGARVITLEEVTRIEDEA